MTIKQLILDRPRPKVEGSRFVIEADVISPPKRGAAKVKIIFNEIATLHLMRTVEPRKFPRGDPDTTAKFKATLPRLPDIVASQVISIVFED